MLVIAHQSPKNPILFLETCYMGTERIRNLRESWSNSEKCLTLDEVLSGLTFAFGYLDDILVYSPDMESHPEHLRLLFERLQNADLKLKEVKCNFLKKHIQYLGHIVSGEGITPLHEKLDSIQKCYNPRLQKKANNFLVS